MRREKAHRLQQNPWPTPVEWALGVFLEDLEPQVRDALVEMNRKGYSTNSSGFYGEHGEKQVIEGAFVLDEPTKQRLREARVVVQEHRVWEGRLFTDLEFRPPTPDLGQIKAKWDQIAGILPDRGTPGVLSWPHGDEFRAAHSPTALAKGE